MLFIIFCVLLAGCGVDVSPKVRQEFSKIEVASIPEKIGWQMKDYLSYRLKPSCPTYRLEITLEQKDYTLKMGQDARSVMVHFVAIAKYTLKNILTQKIMTSGKCSTHNARLLTPSFYSQTVADRKIKEDNALRLADFIIRDLEHFFLSPSWAIQNMPKTTALG
jgi:hypothetical protein